MIPVQRQRAAALSVPGSPTDERTSAGFGSFLRDNQNRTSGRRSSTPVFQDAPKNFKRLRSHSGSIGGRLITRASSESDLIFGYDNPVANERSIVALEQNNTSKFKKNSDWTIKQTALVCFYGM